MDTPRGIKDLLLRAATVSGETDHALITLCCSELDFAQTMVDLARESNNPKLRLRAVKFAIAGCARVSRTLDRLTLHAASQEPLRDRVADLLDVLRRLEQTCAPEEPTL